MLIPVDVVCDINPNNVASIWLLRGNRARGDGAQTWRYRNRPALFRRRGFLPGNRPVPRYDFVNVVRDPVCGSLKSDASGAQTPRK